jgi:hypothetical protein
MLPRYCGGQHLREIDLEEGIRIALDALHADRLAVLCGAGLSMASPSNLPSAAQLASEAKRKYDSTYGVTRDPLPLGIEEQAEFFFQRDQLGTIYLRTLIDAHAFAGPPNPGHTAIADLLLVHAIQTAVSTNVDTLIEAAGVSLLGQVGVGIERRTVAALAPDISPLLKIHGCWSLDRDNTVWAHGQLAVDPVASRIDGNREWLLTRLLDRDLIIVGYFTDWDYLNEVLERTLGEVRPARAVVVDPSPGAVLAGKAPALYGLGRRAQISFCHVRISGAEFLERLRLTFSQAFVRRLLYARVQAYEHEKGAGPDPAWLEPPTISVGDLWHMRRDLEGCFPNKPASFRAPPEEPVLGLALLALRAKGATADGPYWLLAGRRIRVLRTPYQLLHMIQVAFEREAPPVSAPDVIIAVGAEPSSLPPHIVRARTAPSITRGSAVRWLTRQDAVTEFGL